LTKIKGSSIKGDIDLPSLFQGLHTFQKFQKRF